MEHSSFSKILLGLDGSPYGEEESKFHDFIVVGKRTSLIPLFLYH